MTLRYLQLKARAEQFCAKLNDGLMAVALVLAMTVLMVGTYRTVELLASMPTDLQSSWSAAPAGGENP